MTTMKKISRGVIAALFFITLPAFALELGEAKTSGLVGETLSGYIAAVKPSDEVNALVTSINEQRKAHYREIAQKNGIALQDVEALAGKKAIEKTPAGEFIDQGEGWQEK